MSHIKILHACVLVALLPLAAGNASGATGNNVPIRHVIIIMQENRSFDSYFGTFPGADGIPADTCVPLDPSRPNLGCVTPFHDQYDVSSGGPHDASDAQADVNDGITTAKMNGFILQQTKSRSNCPPNAPTCSAFREGKIHHDVVGYHTRDEIPNYWAYAQNFVLQDQLFEGVRSWSWPSHLDLASEWTATCTDQSKASTCTTDPTPPKPGRRLPWVNLFQLLDSKGVSWKYYLGTGRAPDCDDGEMTCPPQVQLNGVPSIWNPAPFFTSVRSKGPKYLKEHNPKLREFLADIQHGRLPEVSWLVPSDSYSEHPPASVTRGMEYVTAMVNAVMQSPYWKDTAIFIAWDDWGGFYDHVVPPDVDRNPTDTPIEGYGLRVPGILISAYAKAGTIDHSVLSFDSYATFIEDVFMNGARLDPSALGNPDRRPDIRDALTKVKFPGGRTAPIGKLMDEFDFTQKPLPPLTLSTHIPSGIVAVCGPNPGEQCTGPVVTISWDPVPADPQTITYHIKRDGQELPQCVGKVTSCTDKPGRGIHLYRAYSVDSDGTTSPQSAAAGAKEP